jgi:hypothetical protein
MWTQERIDKLKEGWGTVIGNHEAELREIEATIKLYQARAKSLRKSIAANRAPLKKPPR